MSGSSLADVRVARGCKRRAWRAYAGVPLVPTDPSKCGVECEMVSCKIGKPVVDGAGVIR